MGYEAELAMYLAAMLGEIWPGNVLGPFQVSARKEDDKEFASLLGRANGNIIVFTELPTTRLIQLSRAVGVPHANLLGHAFFYKDGKPRKFRWDVAIAAKDGAHLRLALVEIQGGVFVGGGHVRGARYQRDAEKALQVAILNAYPTIEAFYLPVVPDGRGKYLARCGKIVLTIFGRE